MKQLKKLSAFILFLIMAVSSLPLSSSAAEIIASGNCGEGYWEDRHKYVFGNSVTWTLDSDGVLTVSGNGAIASDYYIKPEWYENRTNIKTVVISEGVTSIGRSAFSFCTALNSVKIGNSVTNIGDLAFNECTDLTSITIPDGVTSIGSSAFNECTGLTSVTIGNSVTSIGDSVFSGCTSLTSVTIPDSVTSIGYSAFSGCTSLTSVTIPDNVTSIGDSAFSGCDGLTSVAIPDSVTSIGDSTFYNCTGLTSITIGNSVTSIGSSAFYNCIGLTSVTIPESVTSIGLEAFVDCTGLTRINWNAENVSDFIYKYEDGNWNIAIHGCVFANAGTAGDGIDVIFSDNVKNIPKYAFYTDDRISSSPKIKSIIIESSLTSIGDYAFKNCTSLDFIKFEGKPPMFSNYAFSGYNKTVLYPYGISEWKSAIKSSYGGNIKWVLYSKGTVTDLEIKSLPKKTVYYQGETADYTGLSLSATWSDGLTEVVTPYSKIYDITFSGFSTETPGLKTVTATYGGKSVQFEIGVHKTSVFTEEKEKYPESAHNYADNQNETKTYKCPDAFKLVVTFSDDTFVEKDGDYIYVNGKKYTGDELTGKTLTINGDTLTVKLVSDGYGNYYGYSIDKMR